MLVGFGVLGLLAAWKHHGFGVTTYALWGTGFALAVGSRLSGLGRIVYLGVYLPSSVAGYAVSHVLMTLIYLMLFTPLAAGLRIARKDPLQLRAGGRGTWWVQRDAGRPAEDYYRQF